MSNIHTLPSTRAPAAIPRLLYLKLARMFPDSLASLASQGQFVATGVSRCLPTFAFVPDSNEARTLLWWSHDRHLNRFGATAPAFRFFIDLNTQRALLLDLWDAVTRRRYSLDGQDAPVAPPRAYMHAFGWVSATPANATFLQAPEAL